MVQDLPNYAQHTVPIFSLPQEWLWCESWCGNATKSKAKTIDLCNNPMTKEPKLQVNIFCLKFCSWKLTSYHADVFFSSSSIYILSLTISPKSLSCWVEEHECFLSQHIC